MSDATRLEVPSERLSEAALQGVVDDFILREGTDYGLKETPLQTKRDQVIAQLKAGTAVITFDPRTETCTIVVNSGNKP